MGISAIYHYSEEYLRDFITCEPEELCITILDKDIEQEIITNRLAGKSRIMSEPYAEVSAICRKCAEALIDLNTLLMHGAVIAVGSNAYMFMGKSGVGKTTHIRTWLENCKEAYVVNGDKPFVILDRIPIASGSPWSGKERMNTNTMVPLKAIVLMERGEENCIRQISFSDAVPMIMQYVYHSTDEDKTRKSISLIQRLNDSSEVSFWRFKCNNLKEDCFKTAFMISEL